MFADSGFEKRDPGFFRGKEGRGLLVMAALLAVGWPAVFYFGAMKAAPEPPKPPPAVEVTPLPPPDPDPAFQGLRDRTHAQPVDDVAKDLAFRRVRELSPEDLRSRSRRNVTPQELLLHPARYRGLPVHLEGYAKFVAVDEVPGFTPSNRYYEVWINVPPDRRYPCCLIAEDVPNSLPVGRDLDRKVVFDGYFVKLMAYFAVDEERFAPLLIGRLADDPTAPAAKGERSIWWTIWPLGLIFGYLGLRIAFGLRKNLAKTREATRYFSREPEGSFAKAQHIEPDRLNRWLAEAETPDEDPSGDDRD